MAFWPLALLFGIADEIKIRSQKPLPVPPVAYSWDGVNGYIQKKYGLITGGEYYEKVYEAVMTKKFPPDWLKEKWDLNPKEKEFYKDYYHRKFVLGEKVNY